ncbi:hypothetical protein Huta_1311 [Halorhabdus utahensis DSM 12940]|uniref:Uncharacterized protein n=1 Tax=Halorhabdus utahensis (strain DSM 12940 / JCM 11049 / AX-2) TaxID=519442 RepID=C7NN87_HALUD|nr:SipW-dependent-type signal peptide-containing protein [Halorhabdus utahensis]ACV11487.1 hypothetical protein Huta_1311 [Halorhabdus utahensis DSM 12940]
MTVPLRSFAAVLCVVLFVTAGSAATVSYFSDTEQASGTIQAADSFQGGGPGGGTPPGKKAYNDADGDGEYDSDEQTINKNRLRDFNDPDANLVIPSDIGSVSRNGNGNVSITAKSITSSAGFDAKNGGIHLNATDGEISISADSVIGQTGDVTIEATKDIDLNGVTVESDNGAITVSTDGHLDLDNAHLSSNCDIYLQAQTITAQSTTIDSGRAIDITADSDLDIDDATLTSSGSYDIDLQAQTVTARYASVQASNGGTVLNATSGTLDATGADMTGGNAGIVLESVGSMWLNDSTLTTQNGDVTADLGTSATTLYVDNTDIEYTNTLVYDPADISIVGTPKQGLGAVSPSSNP